MSVSISDFILQPFVKVDFCLCCTYTNTTHMNLKDAAQRFIYVSVAFDVQ